MVTKIEKPTVVEAVGSRPKKIVEYEGRVSSATPGVGIARMKSPPGWAEPAQRPEFDEYTVVLEDSLRVETDDGVVEGRAGEGIIVNALERVRYSTPQDAMYMAVRIPAFSPDTVHREG